jgi:hypothetical protein
MFHFTAEQDFGSIELVIALVSNLTTFISQTPLFKSSIASVFAVSPSQVRTPNLCSCFQLFCFCTCSQGSFFWHQNKEGEPLVGVFATNHQPEVLPLYFGARKKNPAWSCS